MPRRIPEEAHTLARPDGAGGVVYLARITGPERAWPTPDPRAALMLSSAAEVRLWVDNLLAAAARRDEAAAARHLIAAARAEKDRKPVPRAPPSTREHLARDLEGFAPAVLIVTLATPLPALAAAAGGAGLLGGPEIGGAA
jgi:hypothetical protein